MHEIIILSVVQGITEFLPISSSAHLILISKYFNFNSSSLTLDISLHLGSLLAIVVYFRKDIFDFIKNKNIFLKVLISSIPTMIVGYFLIYYSLIDYLRDPILIGWTTIIFGILLYFSDKKQIKNSIKNDYSFKAAISIGFFQVLSLIPGVSRAGVTITGARIFGFNRTESTKISFLMSIPTLAAVGMYNLKDLYLNHNYEFSILNLFAILLSYFFSYLTIRYFIIYVKKFNLTIFVIYRILLGAVILLFSFL